MQFKSRGILSSSKSLRSIEVSFNHALEIEASMVSSSFIGGLLKGLLKLSVITRLLKNLISGSVTHADVFFSLMYFLDAVTYSWIYFF